jgi:hypothetical protein
VRCRWPQVLGTVVLLLATPALGGAQGRKAGASSEPAGYREAIDTALQEVELGNYDEAREQFARAHALFPNARTLRGLGIAEFERRHYVTAVEHLEAALASSVRPVEGKMRADTEALLTRAKGYVGTVTLAVAPGDATVLVDGIRRLEPGQDAVRLDVGDHVLELRAEGYATERREITVHGGQTEHLDVQLASLATSARSETTPAPIPAQAPADAAPSERVPVYKRWWLWTIVGVVVAGAAAGTAVALTRKTSTEYRPVPTDTTPMGAGLQPWRF